MFHGYPYIYTASKVVGCLHSQEVRDTYGHTKMENRKIVRLFWECEKCAQTNSFALRPSTFRTKRDSRGLGLEKSRRCFIKQFYGSVGQEPAIGKKMLGEKSGPVLAMPRKLSSGPPCAISIATHKNSRWTEKLACDTHSP